MTTARFRGALGQLISWELNDFKAVEHGIVEFPGFTVLLGANSAGKSSVIQSILALAQVLQGSYGNRFPLVGELARLGSIREVSRGALGSFSVSAGFERGRVSFHVKQDEIGQFSDPNEIGESALEAQIVELSVLRSEPLIQGAPVHFTISIVNPEEDSLEISNGWSGNRRDLPLAKYLIHGSYPCDGFCENSSPGQPHQVPDGATVSWNPAERSMRLGPNVQFGGRPVFDQAIRSSINARVEGLTHNASLSALGEMVIGARQLPEGEQRRLLRGISDIFQANGSDSTTERLLKLQDSIQQESISSLWYLLLIFDEDRGTVPAAVAQELSALEASSVWKSFETPMPICWGTWLEKFNEILDSVPESIKYLGPLRQDPQILQSPLPAPNGMAPLGRSGEHTTHLIWQSERLWFSDPFPTPDGVGSGSLEEAISAWMAFLEMGSPVTFRSSGNSGFETIVGGKSIHSLGIGVSQLLPVLALCLSERMGRVLLVEQPELHLHPSAQQKLADFFIAMAQNGRKIMIETHSEYLITRLRRRVAVDEIERDKYLLVFVEKNNETSSFKSSKLSDTGQFSYWPTGFFGQVEEDLLAILEADVRKQENL